MENKVFWDSRRPTRHTEDVYQISSSLMIPPSLHSRRPSHRSDEDCQPSLPSLGISNILNVWDKAQGVVSYTKSEDAGNVLTRTSESNISTDVRLESEAKILKRTKCPNCLLTQHLLGTQGPVEVCLHCAAITATPAGGTEALHLQLYMQKEQI